ncbi:hypothetical protein T4A_6895 [Trichinella pseudospiralis]|uniref:Uncharacterized protein n=1 Tax=Trichinella pseudospiralis TaxID=6337 RepID=A0A0V0Y3G6_TRIPS|nr:hypothetical protein T4E_12296 [Trichinella pseudospiralis]KRY72858.1 hypothetical protein T4A_6895 [Trichinella pseudospiralis]
MNADVEKTSDWKEAVLKNASPIKRVQIFRIHLPAQQDVRYELQEDGAEDEAAQAAQCGPLVRSLEAFQAGVHFQISRANERHVRKQGEQSAEEPETDTQNCQRQKTSRCDDFHEKALGSNFVVPLLLKRANQIDDQLHAGQEYHHCSGIDAEGLRDEVEIQHDALPSFCQRKSSIGIIEIATHDSSSVTLINKVKHQCAQEYRNCAVDNGKN